jgi:ketosteroid isomerase-like protein
MNSPNVDPDVQAIENLLYIFEEAVAGGDASRLPGLFCEQATAFFTGSSDLFQGRDEIVKTWQNHMAKWSDVIIRRHKTLVRIHGDVAWAQFYWDGQGTSGQDRYCITDERWSVVMLWEEGDWRLAQMHTSLPYQNWESLKL